MTRSVPLTASLTLACLLGLAQAARAQYAPGTNPYTRPAVNPYVNLLRQGATPGFNYSTLVRPEIDFRSSINQLSGQTLANQQAITGLAQQNLYGGPLVTGAQVGFQNHLVYFQSLSGGPGGFGSLYGYGNPGIGFGMGQGGAGLGGLRGQSGGAFGAPAASGASGATPPSRGRSGR